MRIRIALGPEEWAFVGQGSAAVAADWEDTLDVLRDSVWVST